MSTEPLIIRWPGGEKRVLSGQAVSVGRDRENTVTLNSSTISRRHGEIAEIDGVWTYTDLRSTQGSFVDGSAVGQLPLRQGTSIRLGQGPDAVVLELIPPAPGTAGTASAGPGYEPTRATNGARPGGRLTPAAAGKAATVVPQVEAAQPLRVKVGEEARVLRPGSTLAIGRDDDNAIVLDDSSVSRHHLLIEQSADPAQAGRWQLRDLGSSAGTWLDGVRVQVQALTGEQAFRLGDKDAGPLVETLSSTPAGPTGPVVLPAGPAAPAEGTRSGRRLGLIAAGLAVVLVLAVSGGALAYLRSKGVDRDTLARATVKLSITAGSQGWSGSGTIIDRDRGLILTNAHVADPASKGFAVNTRTLADDADPAVDRIVISVTSGIDRSAEPRFVGKVVAADGYLDLAVVKITQSLTGALVEPADLAELAELELGDSAETGAGDGVRILGYPGLAQSNAPTLTTGIVSGVQEDPRLRSNRAYLNTDASFNHGNSGGLAADDKGQIIGVPTLKLLDQSDSDTSLWAFRPINFARPLIDAAVTGKTYESPWTTDFPAEAKITGLTFAAPGTAGAIQSGCAAGEQSTGLISLGLQYAGLPEAENTDLQANVYVLPTGSTTAVRVGAAVTTFPTHLGAGAGCATLTLAPTRDDVDLTAGIYTLKVGLGGFLRTVYTTTFSYPPVAVVTPSVTDPAATDPAQPSTDAPPVQ